eukprot:jgi/Bigna1/67729/fgenesh1_pg.4_\
MGEINRLSGQQIKDLELLEALSKPRHEVDLRKVESILSMKADANVKNEEGETVLILAAKSGNFPVVKMLLEEREKDAARQFCSQDLQHVLRILSKLRNNFNARHQKDIIEQAEGNSSWFSNFYCTAQRGVQKDLEQNETTLSQRLLRKLRRIKEDDLEEEETDRRSMKLMEQLTGAYEQLQYKANFKHGIERSEPPHEKRDIPPEFLLGLVMPARSKAFIIDTERINAQDDNGDTALHKAATGGFLAIVKLLIRHGANITLENRDGWTPFMAAVASGHAHIFYYLAEGSAKCLRSNPQTVFQVACTSSLVPIIRYIYMSAHPFIRKSPALMQKVYLSGRRNTLRFLASKGFPFQKKDQGERRAPGILECGEAVIVQGKPAIIVRQLHNGPPKLRRPKRVYLIRYYHPKYLEKPRNAKSLILSTKEDIKLSKDKAVMGKIRTLLERSSTPHDDYNNARGDREKDSSTRNNWSFFSKEKPPPKKDYNIYELSKYEEVRWDLSTEDLLPKRWTDRFITPLKARDKMHWADDSQIPPKLRAPTEFDHSALSANLAASEEIGLLEPMPECTPYLLVIDFPSWSFQYRYLAKFLTILPGPRISELPTTSSPSSSSSSSRGKSHSNDCMLETEKATKRADSKRRGLMMRQIYIHKTTGKQVSPSADAKADIIYDEKTGEALFYHMELLINNVKKESVS